MQTPYELGDVRSNILGPMFVGSSNVTIFLNPVANLHLELLMFNCSC